MPSVSPKQAKTMRAVAHNPEFAAKIGIPVKVGQEFEAADEAKVRNSAIVAHLRERR